MRDWTVSEWAILKAMMQTVMAAFLLLFLVYVVFTKGFPIDQHQLIELILVILSLSTGATNLGKLYAYGPK